MSSKYRELRLLDNVSSVKLPVGVTTGVTTGAVTKCQAARIWAELLSNVLSKCLTVSSVKCQVKSVKLRAFLVEYLVKNYLKKCQAKKVDSYMST